MQVADTRILRRTRASMAYVFRRSVFWIGFHIRPPIRWFAGLFSKVGNPPVFGRDVFVWVPRLEANWETIRDEALRVLERPEDREDSGSFPRTP